MSSVYLYIYDISKGMVKQLSPLFFGKTIEGIWHTSIVVYEKEFFYGGFGITNCQPGKSIAGIPDQKIFMGNTNHTIKDFQNHINNVSNRFSPEQYSLLHHNCNTFTDEMCFFLTKKRIPAHITKLPSEIMSTPLGQQLLPLIESFEGIGHTGNRPSQQNPTGGNIPFASFFSASNPNSSSHTQNKEKENESQKHSTFKSKNSAMTEKLFTAKAYDENTSVYVASILKHAAFLNLTANDETILSNLPIKIQSALKTSSSNKEVSDAEADRISTIFEKCLFTKKHISSNGKSHKARLPLLAVMRMLVVCDARLATLLGSERRLEAIWAALDKQNSPSIRIVAASVLCGFFVHYETSPNVKSLIERMCRREGNVEMTAKLIAMNNESLVRGTGSMLLHNMAVICVHQKEASSDELITLFLSVLFDKINEEKDTEILGRLIKTTEMFVLKNEKARCLVKLLGFEINCGNHSDKKIGMALKNLEDLLS